MTKEKRNGLFIVAVSLLYTVCPGSSDPPEKNLIYVHQKMKFTPFINYYNTLG